MGTGFVIAGWVIALVLVAAAASSAARVRGNWRDPGAWAVPLVFACLAVIAVTVLGVLAPLTGGIIAGILAAAEGVFLWRGDDKPLYAFAGHLGGGFRHLHADTRSLASRARPGEPAAAAAQQTAPAQPAAPRPVSATPGVPPWRRSVPGVPSIHADPALGDAPAPADVAVALEAAGVMVPRTWAAVAEDAAEFDPENEDDLCGHMDGEAAGILTWAEAVMARTENLGEGGAGLHPAYIAAHYEFADDIAELASHAAQVSKRYHLIHDDLREAADGAPLPANRFWFGDGGAPQGGQAA